MTKFNVLHFQHPRGSLRDVQHLNEGQSIPAQSRLQGKETVMI